MLTAKEWIFTLERAIQRMVDEEGKVEYDKIRTAIDDTFSAIDDEPKRIEKFIFVEDGTVDVDELEERLAMTNPEIKVVVYRQGARPPELLEVKK